MGFGLAITFGEFLVPLPEKLKQWLVEARVEMELSTPSRYALRFEDDICDGRHEVADDLTFERDTDLGLFVKRGEGGWECLVLGPITKVRSSSVFGGPGSWVEFHGEDRRNRMGRATIQSKHRGKASGVAEKILTAYKFTPSVQETLVEHDDQKRALTQSATDLAFLEDVARRNNMDFWLEYEVLAQLPATSIAVTARLGTSPERKQSFAAPPAPVKLTPDKDLELRVAPPDGACANLNRFDTRINYERPASVRGFAMSGEQQKKIVEQLVSPPEPLDSTKVIPVKEITRQLAPVTKPSPEEAYFMHEAIVFEQSWFVEADCSASYDQLGFVVRPHQVLRVSHAGDSLSGPYQVLKVTHVVTATNHLMDFTIRANGLGGRK